MMSPISIVNQCKRILRHVAPAYLAGRARQAVQPEFAREEGSALVEMALTSVIIIGTMIGIMEFGMAFYTYTFVSDAAREASRYASVRGATSCTDDVTADPNCNLLPNSSGNPLQAYVKGLGFPGSGTVTVTATWLVASQNANGYTSWTTSCTGATDTNGNPCNAMGNAVKVVVTAPVTVAMPFYKTFSLTVSSTSQMVISE